MRELDPDEFNFFSVLVLMPRILKADFLQEVMSRIANFFASFTFLCKSNQDPAWALWNRKTWIIKQASILQIYAGVFIMATQVSRVSWKDIELARLHKAYDWKYLWYRTYDRNLLIKKNGLYKFINILEQATKCFYKGRLCITQSMSYFLHAFPSNYLSNKRIIYC